MPHHRKASANAADASSSLMERLLADPVLVPLLVTAIAIAVLHLTQPDASLHDLNARYAAALPLHGGDTAMPILAGLGAARPVAPETPPEAMTSIR
ncbi:hypothetical protein [Shinella sp.]|uniref:hypothetical protein n=1 Tax=Shinella sp. TaxID=1870904 RepID=UPI0028983B16|nr:hypothetical protein [Shinella sp.]